MIHVVTLDKDDTVCIKFSQFPNLILNVPHFNALEAALQAELSAMREQSTRERNAEMVRNVGASQAQDSKHW